MRDKEIIFFDTEFSSLDPYRGEILSIGMVKESCEELYLELEFEGEYSDWVKENLLHTLNGRKVSRKSAREKIRQFAGKNEPLLMTLNGQYDIIYLYKLFDYATHDDKNCPFFWIPLDLVSILYALKYDPEEYIEDPKAFAENLGIDTSWFTQHNALDDAKLMRETYLKLKGQNNG